METIVFNDDESNFNFNNKNTVIKAANLLIMKRLWRYCHKNSSKKKYEPCGCQRKIYELYEMLGASRKSIDNIIAGKESRWPDRETQERASSNLGIPGQYLSGESLFLISGKTHEFICDNFDMLVRTVDVDEDDRADFIEYEDELLIDPTSEEALWWFILKYRKTRKKGNGRVIINDGWNQAKKMLLEEAAEQARQNAFFDDTLRSYYEHIK